MLGIPALISLRRSITPKFKVSLVYILSSRLARDHSKALTYLNPPPKGNMGKMSKEGRGYVQRLKDDRTSHTPVP